ncbi:FecR family protein [Sphingobacterium cellulitidis]|uniref:Iron dicitrate transporter FecR n=1 Tax=Sphingobacterium cellulitidis TaxID=1768011 RepID=A0A8H9KV11_9SPHI|nr:FecR family protein [Sphingobacterium soli]MBA8986708.1 hypothetical protein [Sphingobacterium soli]GGE27134.1 iron dicitrate transporter FecR [Sphingobacterium soli]
MNPKEKYISTLIFKHLQGICTIQESRKLRNWIEEDINNKKLFNRCINFDYIKEDLALLNSFDAKKSWKKRKKYKRLLFIKWFVAASILLGTLLFIPTDFWKKGAIEVLSKNKRKPVNSQIQNNSVQLILADGKKIKLNDPLELNTDTFILSGKNIIPVVSSINSAEKENILEIQVSNTKIYSFTLPDSSKVWLNSNSNIQFPSQFNHAQRIVSIQGEAYFEVKPNKKQPFIVKTNLGDIRVLGTSFNIKNYNNGFEATLVEGNIEIKTKKYTKQIKPLEKAIIAQGEIGLYTADLEKDLAWKQNIFLFRNDKLSEIIPQIENWYGIQSQYKTNKTPDETFSGTINRDVSLKQIINILNHSSAHQFHIQNNQLIISETKL